MRSRIAESNSRGTAASVIWAAVHPGRWTIFALILISFFRIVGSNQCFMDAGKDLSGVVSELRSLPALSTP